MTDAYKRAYAILTDTNTKEKRWVLMANVQGMVRDSSDSHTRVNVVTSVGGSELSVVETISQIIGQFDSTYNGYK